MGVALPTAANPSNGKSPNANDVANGVVTTTQNTPNNGGFTAQGQVSQPFTFYGAVNIALYPVVTTTLTTQAASSNATVASGTGLGVGDTIISTLVPAGATIASTTTFNVGTITTVQIGGLSTIQIGGLTAGSDVAAMFVGPCVGGASNYAAVATIALEKSYDGGTTWITCGIGGGGTPATYQFGGSSGLTDAVSFIFAEPEVNVAYRLNCRQWTSGVIKFRLSASGLSALSWGIPVG